MSRTQSPVSDYRRPIDNVTRPVSDMEHWAIQLRGEKMLDLPTVDDDSVIEAAIQFDSLPIIPGLTLYDISCERYREYDFGDRVYRIENPIGLYLRAGGTTHRIVDKDGTSHCAPFPGKHTVIRWVNWDLTRPVNF